MDRDVVDALRRCREAHRFNRALVAWTGFRHAEVSYTAAPRHSGQAKWGWKGLLRYAMDGILSFSIRPLRLVGLAGILVSTASFLYLMVIAVRRIVSPDGPWAEVGFASVIGMVALLSGSQLLGTWLLGEYIGRIYEQVKGRPPYILRQPRERGEAIGAATPHSRRRPARVPEGHAPRIALSAHHRAPAQDPEDRSA
jgi:hypothetical protein